MPKATVRLGLCVFAVIASFVAYRLFFQLSSYPIMSGQPSKRGLCWPVENKQDNPFLFTRPSSKISWLYNWSPNPTPDASSLKFVPMQWNTASTSDLQSKATSVHATHILAYNEPELPDQSNISARDAANDWIRFIEPLRKTGIKCGSPGISNAGHAIGWLLEFLKLIREKGSDVDFYAFHWYGPELGGFYDYIWSAYYQMPTQDKPVWITEFACTNWDKDNPLPREHVEKFAKDAVKYLDELAWVERYAWFGPMRDVGTVGRWARMIDDDGQLTPLGKAYRDE